MGCITDSAAKQNPQRIVFAEADTYKILKAAQIVRDEGIARPILLGNLGKITRLIEENNLDLGDTPIIDGQTVIYVAPGKGGRGSTMAFKVEKKGDAFTTTDL